MRNVLLWAGIAVVGAVEAVISQLISNTVLKKSVRKDAREELIAAGYVIEIDDTEEE